MIDAPLAARAVAARRGAAAPARSRSRRRPSSSTPPGTTGTPRPVVLTLGQILHNALGCAVALGHDRRERWLCPLPLSHVGGLMVLLRSAIYGTTAVLGPADRTDVTIASLVPTQLGRLLDREPPPSLRVVMLGGAPADPTLLTRARDAGWPVAPTYGLTQACSAVTVAQVGRHRDLRAAAPGRLGRRSRPTARSSSTARPSPGACTPATSASSTSAGACASLGRKVDTIVSGGENVMPSEVEAALLAHPAVAEAGVFGRPDPEWGEAVTAHVVLRAPARAGRAARRSPPPASPASRSPRRSSPSPSLPRNAGGKLLRRELR